MTAGVADVKAVTPHVAFTYKRWSESDSPTAAGIVSDPIIRVDVPANDWGRLGEHNVLSRDKFSQVGENFVL